MCIKIGTKIKVSEEAKNIVELHQQKIDVMWRLITQASSMIHESHQNLWIAIRKLHPELDNYELSYSNNAIIVIKEKQ